VFRARYLAETQYEPEGIRNTRLTKYARGKSDETERKYSPTPGKVSSSNIRVLFTVSDPSSNTLVHEPQLFPFSLNLKIFLMPLPTLCTRILELDTSIGQLDMD
jgi:hypothetical protein